MSADEGDMTRWRVAEVAEVLRVSDDTVRRWIDQDRLPGRRDAAGRLFVAGEDLATFLRSQRTPDGAEGGLQSARNRFDGVVTEVRRDGLVAQVEMQAGPFRVVSLMTREAADELALRPGSPATAVVKATSVVVQADERGRR